MGLCLKVKFCHNKFYLCHTCARVHVKNLFYSLIQNANSVSDMFPVLEEKEQIKQEYQPFIQNALSDLSPLFEHLLVNICLPGERNTW